MSLVKSFRARFARNLFDGAHVAWRQVYALIVWTLGCFAMTYVVGPVCKMVLWGVFRGDGNRDDPQYLLEKRAKVVRILRRIFPDEFSGAGPGAENKGLIVGFNHPTLHEVFGLVAWTLGNYPERRNNFPTNLPWYESICTCKPFLHKLGVHITPMITQSTFGRLEKIHADDAEAIETITYVRDSLLNFYFTVAIDFERSGDNTFAAPSTTRQATIFPHTATDKRAEGGTAISGTATGGTATNGAKLLPVMSSLMFRITRANRNRAPEVVFLPITVIPPKTQIKRMRGLKPFRRFHMIFGRGFSFEEAKKMGRSIDHIFLERLAENAPEELIYSKSAHTRVSSATTN